MLLLDGRRQHDDRRARGAAPAAKPRSSRSMPASGAASRAAARSRRAAARDATRRRRRARKAPRDQRVARHVAGPGLGQRAGEREQHRPPGERDESPPARTTWRQASTTSALRGQQRLDLVEPQRPLLAARRSARRRASANARAPGRPRPQRRDAGCARRRRRPASSAARAGFARSGACAMPAATSSCAARSAAAAASRSSAPSAALGLVEAAEQQEPPARRDSRAWARSPGRHALRASPAPPRAPAPAAEIARGQRDLGLGDDAACAGQLLVRPKPRAARRRSVLRAREVAELRHRDAAQRERRRVVAQGDPLQRAERIARRERTRRSRDQRVHRNPVTLVTPTLRRPVPD